MRPREEDQKVDPVGPRTRNHTRYDFPSLRQPRLIMVPTSQRPSEPPHYKLYGVLYHHSESAGSGHCTVDVDVLHSNGDGDAGEVWLHVNEEVVTWLRHEDMFGAWY